MRRSSRAISETVSAVPSCEPSSTTMIDTPPVKSRCAVSPARQVAILPISLRAGTMIATAGRATGSMAGRPSDAARCVRNCRRRRNNSQPVSASQAAPASSAAI
jgi:hypothetical protein